MISPETVFSRNLGVWGDKNQKALEQATILVAGVGGLGSVVTETLVRSGVGRLILVDDGVVDSPDLNRQILYTKSDIGRVKVEVAAERLSAVHGLTEIIPLCQRLEAGQPLETDVPFEEIDGLVDCLDNYNSRYILEQMATEDIFLVHGGVQEHYGQVTTIRKNQTPTLATLYANTEDSDSPLPVCSQAVACIASIMSYEVLNNLWDQPQLMNVLQIIELSDFTFSKIELG
jgi:molybdopterin-synthase adenylyltransferase